MSTRDAVLNEREQIELEFEELIRDVTCQSCAIYRNPNRYAGQHVVSVKTCRSCGSAAMDRRRMEMGNIISWSDGYGDNAMASVLERSGFPFAKFFTGLHTYAYTDKVFGGILEAANTMSLQTNSVMASKLRYLMRPENRELRLAIAAAEQILKDGDFTQAVEMLTPMFDSIKVFR